VENEMLSRATSVNRWQHRAERRARENRRRRRTKMRRKITWWRT
jgi:hypothetical protein